MNETFHGWARGMMIDVIDVIERRGGPFVNFDGGDGPIQYSASAVYILFETFVLVVFSTLLKGSQNAADRKGRSKHIHDAAI